MGNPRLKSILTVAIFLGLCFLLARATPNSSYLREQQFRQMLSALLPTLTAQTGQHPLALAPTSQLPATELKDKALELFKQHNNTLGQPQKPVQIYLQLTQRGGQLELSATHPQAKTPLTRSQNLIRWYSVLPPLLAVAATLLTHRLILSLLLGIFCGALIHASLNPLQAVPDMVGYLWHASSDSAHVKILLFGSILLGMVGVMNACAGTRGLVEVFRRFTRDRFSTLLITAGMGVLLFFDDYAHCFILGGTLRPVTDRQRISREKLAFLVDATAATMASFALVSTWIGYQVGLFQDALKALNLPMGGYQAFLMALPFRFYCLLTVVLIFLLIFLRRDFGPMYAAERRALVEGLVLRDGAVPMTSSQFNSLEAHSAMPARWYNAALPVLVMIGLTIAGLYVNGGGWARVQAQPAQILNFQVLSDSFSQADSGLVLLWASILGSLCALLLAVAQKLLRPLEALKAWYQGALSVWLALTVLVLAWSLSQVSQEIGTATYVIAIFRDLLHPAWVPVLVFLLAGATAFAIGSSWSAMAILVPMALPLAHELGGTSLMLITMGAVLDGAIFGDHCSPLTDTSILSSMACSSDHLDHIHTQLPYGLLTLFTAAFCCYLPAALGLMPVISLLIGAAALFVFIRVVGRDPEANLPPTPARPAAHLRPENVLAGRYSEE